MTASNTINFPETLRDLAEDYQVEIAQAVAVLLDPDRPEEWVDALDDIERLLSGYEDKPTIEQTVALTVARARAAAGVWNPEA